MKTVNAHEARTHLSRLIDEAAAGEPFIIARAGKPVVKVVAVDAPTEKPKSRIGFLSGISKIPETREEFKAIAADEIEQMFYGEHD